MSKKFYLVILVFLLTIIQTLALTQDELSAEMSKNNNPAKIKMFDSRYDIVILNKNGKFGIMKFQSDSDIYKVNSINCDFDNIEKIEYQPNTDYKPKYYYKIEKNNKVGIFDSNGDTIPPLYDDIKITWEKSGQMFPEEMFIVSQAGKKGAFLKQQQYSLVIPVMYDDIDYKNCNTRFKYSETTLNGKKGAYIIGDSGSGNITLPAYFDEIEIQPPYILTKQYGKYGVYHLNRQVVPIYYDKVKPDNNNIIVTLNNQQGAYNDDGILVVPVGYDEVFLAENSSYAYGKEPYFIVRKGNRYGIHGKIPVEFDKIEQIYRGYIVEKNNKYGLYHLTKGRLLKPEYDKIYLQDSSTVKAERNGKVVKIIDMNKTSIDEKATTAFYYTCFWWLLIPLQGLH